MSLWVHNQSVGANKTSNGERKPCHAQWHGG